MAETAHHQRPESWGRKALDYEALFVPFSDGVAREALARVDVQPGERLLDVAAGTGAVSLRALDRGARVTAVDFSEPMLGRLRQKTRTRTDVDLSVQVMDGQAMTFPDASFDVAGSSLGLVFFVDPAGGLRELKRVLRPAGRVFVTSLANPGESTLMRLVLGSVFEVAPDFRPSVGPAPLALSTPEEMQSALCAAGFRRPRAEVVSVPWPIVDARDFFARWALCAPPTAAMMAELPAPLRERAAQRFVEKIDARSHGGIAVFETNVLIGVANK